MKLFFILLLIGNSFASTQLSKDWISETSTVNPTDSARASFDAILEAQATALDSMDSEKNMKLLPFGYKMNEMVTDIAVSKSGLLGLSALKSNNGVEIKWKKVSRNNLIDTSEEVSDVIVSADASNEDLDKVSDTILKLVESSGKVRNNKRTRKLVREALSSINEKVKNIQVTSLNQWKARGLRLDLNFSANGNLRFFTKAGVALRIRMEWKLKEMSLTKAETALVNGETRFMVRVLDGLNKSLDKATILGFEAKKISIGVGGSQKKGLFGLWKYSAGFIGYISFVPVKMNTKSFAPVLVPSEVLNDGFTVGGEDENSISTKNAKLIVSNSFSHDAFISGIEKSLKTAAFFAERAFVERSTKWTITDIKTINDMTYTGFFGLADFTTKGAVEIDFKRK